MKLTNLWEETTNKLKEHSLSFDDVLYIQGKDFGITKENFKEVAKRTDYHSGFGAQKVAKDLILVGKGWWLERGEYDGSEWWRFVELPEKLEKIIEIDILSGGRWASLKELNLEDEVEV